jgi:hypothetical protein
VPSLHPPAYRRGATLRVTTVSGIVTRYALAPGDDDVHALVSVGGWAACARCAALIDLGDIDALGRRVVASLALAGMPPAYQPAVARQIYALLRGFWHHRRCLN